MKRISISILFTLVVVVIGCSHRPPMDMKQHATMAPAARMKILSTFSDVDSALLEEKGSGGMFDDQGHLERYTAEYRLPVNTNGVFVFFRIEMDTTREPPVVTFLTRGTGQVERVLCEKDVSP
jgi:hypothetical protein